MLLHSRHRDASSNGKMLHLLTVLLIFGYTSAVPFYGDLMHPLTPPQPLHLHQHRLLQPIQPSSFAPMARFTLVEPQTQASQSQPQIWQRFANNPFPFSAPRNSPALATAAFSPHQTRRHFSSFDDDAEFVPLEQQSRGTEGPSLARIPKPFDIDVVTSEVNGQNNPGILFQHSFPFFGPDFFNSFGGFGIGAGPQQEPWWKGPNVCTDKKEDEKSDDPKENTENADETEELTPGASESIDVRPPLFGQFHFSVNSCIEKPNKYICSRILNENGKKKTLTITRQCCHGYGRSRNADFTTPCEKIEIKNVEATAVDMGAQEFLASAKSSGSAGDMLINRKNQTIFMPVDKAFENYVQQLQNENSVVESKNDGNLYLRHIVNGEISMDDVSNEQLLKTLQTGQSIRINRYQMPLALANGEPYRQTANCVPIEKHDKLSEQGMVHALSGVLKPVTKNIMDIIRQRADMSIMRTVLEKTKLSELLEQTEKPMTIFVPTDSAFDKLEPNLRRALKEGKGCASNILKNHMLDLTFCSIASVPGAKTTAYNILGEQLRFNRTKSPAVNAEKSEVADLVGEQQQPIVINGIAKITESDIMGTNGVMHVLDTILPTESALPLTTLMQEKNVTIFKRLLEAAGLNEKFDDMDNVTVFAPTDKALQGTKWAQLLNDSPDQLSNNPELIEFLNYHISLPMIKTCELEDNALLSTVAGPKVKINLFSTHALFSNVMNRATVNCARLVHFDDESCGTVMHQVDKVLTPPKMNLLEMLESNPEYSKFLELIRSANLTDVLANSDESYTLLVPKNDVFLEFDTNLSPAELERLVKTHIVNDTVCCAGIIPTNWPFVRTIQTIDGSNLRITRERRPKVENAGITKCDSIAVNGIIHEINDVIDPQRRQYRPQELSLTEDLF